MYILMEIRDNDLYWEDNEHYETTIAVSNDIELLKKFAEGKHTSDEIQWSDVSYGDTISDSSYIGVKEGYIQYSIRTIQLLE